MRLLSPGPVGTELEDRERCFPLTAADFARVNPNTGTAPIFRSRRDADLTTAIYRRLPVLVDRSSGEAVKAWPVKYATMFHMTNDSGLFRTRAELEETEGAYPIGGNRFDSPSGEWVPLYVGQDDPGNSTIARRRVEVKSGESAQCCAERRHWPNADQKADPAFVPTPQCIGCQPAKYRFPEVKIWRLSGPSLSGTSPARPMLGP